jgi:hypothetical protein
MAIRFGRHTPDSWLTPEVITLKVVKRFGRKSGRIMFPTSHDIDSTNLDDCLTVLTAMLKAGNDVLIVSKPNLKCIRRLCDQLRPYQGQITFRFTMGSADDAVLKAWEPHAPQFGERLKSLQLAFNAGFQTSVSCEPMLDGNIHEVIRKAKPFVTDSIWLGVANRLRGIIAINCPGDAKAKSLAEALIAVMSEDFIQSLYARYKADPVVKWKDSIKKVVGLERPIEKGLDV